MAKDLAELEERANADGRNLNFVQFDRAAMAAHRQLILENPVGAALLTLFIENMDANNAIIISYATMQEMTGYSRAAVGRAVRKLKDDLWVQTIKVGTANVYVINSHAFWTTSRDKKAYSKFHATVIASASEQAMTIDKLKSVRLKQVPMLHANERAIITTEELPPPDQTDMELD